MNITLTFDQILLCQISLMAMLSPLGVIGSFAALTADYSRSVQRKLSWRVSLYCFVTLILISWGGNLLLKILGISLDALSAAGGLILMLTSLPLVLKGASPRKKVDPESISEEDWHHILMTPLVFPLTMGAGTISFVIAFAGQMETLADRLVFDAIIAVHCLFIWIIYSFSGPLSKKVGPQGNLLMNRVAGIVLVSLAFTLLTNGLKGLLPGLN